MFVLLSSLLFIAAFFAAAFVIAHTFAKHGARVLAVLSAGGAPTPSQSAKSQRTNLNFLNFTPSRSPLRAAA
jgi:hypothetical protein